MGLLKKRKQETPKKEMVRYIENAGGCIVTKSLLDGKSHLKWLFREESVNPVDNGWRAFGAEDTQEYINDSNNLVVCDFNTLANIEPTVLHVYEMPVGADLEFVDDASGKYFINTETGEEIREPVKSPLQTAFEKNLKFISQTDFDLETVKGLFHETDKIKCFELGNCEFPSGHIIIADPLCYLQDKNSVYVLEKSVASGSYPVTLSVLYSEMAGVRIAGARLKITENIAVKYELAEPEKGGEEKRFPPMAGFAVEAGMGCFCDEQAAKDYWTFLAKWYAENPQGNIYDDYFASLFAESYEKEPGYQREGGDFLLWKNPVADTDSQIAMFASGMGDGYYPGIWGIDEKGELCELVVLFMNPELF